MILKLSPKRQRLLALVLLLGAVALAVLFVVLPLLEASRQHGERMGLLRRQAQAMEAMIDARERFEAAVAALEANTALQSLTVSADGPAIAGAQVQGQLTQILSAAGAMVTSAQVLPEEPAGPLTRIRMQMAAETDMGGLVKILHGVATARPLLTVERLSVRDPDGLSAPPAGTANRLQVELVVLAHMRVP
jgi:general secretion pathway protein M